MLQNQNESILKQIADFDKANVIPKDLGGNPIDESAFGAASKPPAAVEVVAKEPRPPVFTIPQYDPQGKIIDPIQDEKPIRSPAQPRFPNLPNNLVDQTAQFKFLKSLKDQQSMWDLEDPSYQKLQDAFPWN